MKVTLNNVGSLVDYTTAGTTINNNFDTIETAFDNTLSRDGTSPNTMSANLDMNSQQILNLPAPATANSPLRLQDLEDFVGGGTVTNIPSGGTTGQVLAKVDNTNYNVAWTSESAELTAGTNIVLTGTTPTTISTTLTPSFTSATITGLTASSAVATDGSKGLVSVTNTGSGSNVLATSPTLVTPILGTPTSGTLTSCTGLPISTGVSGLASNVATFLGTPSSANLITAVTDETGSGALVFANTPTLVTPILGTPTSGTLTTCTGLPISTGVSGLAAGVATFLATPSSANLITAVTDETGSGALVFGTTPTLSTPAIIGRTNAGSPTAGNVGEVLSQSIASGSAVTLTTNTAANIATITLTAGDWEVDTFASFINAATTSTTQYIACISTTTATLDTTTAFSYAIWNQPATVSTATNTITGVGPRQFNVSGSTQIWLVVRAIFTVAGMTCYGAIRARRVQS